MEDLTNLWAFLGNVVDISSFIIDMIFTIGLIVTGFLVKRAYTLMNTALSSVKLRYCIEDGKFTSGKNYVLALMPDGIHITAYGKTKLILATGNALKLELLDDFSDTRLDIISGDEHYIFRISDGMLLKVRYFMLCCKGL